MNDNLLATLLTQVSRLLNKFLDSKNIQKLQGFHQKPFFTPGILFVLSFQR